MVEYAGGCWVTLLMCSCYIDLLSLAILLELIIIIINVNLTHSLK